MLKVMCILHTFQSSVAIHKENIHWICNTNQMAGFYIKCNTGLEWVQQSTQGNHWSWYRCIFEREFIIVNSNFYFIQFFVLWELFSTTPIPREMSSFFEIFPLTWVSHKKTWPYIINISYSTTKNRKTKAITTNNEELHLLKLSHEPEFYSPSLSWRCL